MAALLEIRGKVREEGSGGSREGGGKMGGSEKKKGER